MATTPFRLELDDDHWLVGDERDGDRPAYVFLHGLSSVRAGEKSQSLLEHAQSRGRGFLRFDMRGHGESSGRLGQVHVRSLIDDAIAMLERVGRACIVGSSLGGLVAAHAAAARPDLVERLALLAPAFGLMPNLDRHLDERGHMRVQSGESFFVEPDVLAEARAIDEAGLPSRLRTPVLLVHGTADDVIPQIVSEHFHAAVTHAPKDLWIVPGGDHRLNTVARDIWRRLDALPTA